MKNQKPYDLIISRGRVMDPETGLDGVLNIGILNGRIEVVDSSDLQGHDVIQAEGLVVAPGFIDTHVHLIYHTIRWADNDSADFNQAMSFSGIASRGPRNASEPPWYISGSS